jgi:hypothetical protein
LIFVPAFTQDIENDQAGQVFHIPGGVLPPWLGIVSGKRHGEV